MNFSHLFPLILAVNDPTDTTTTIYIVLFKWRLIT